MQGYVESVKTAYKNLNRTIVNVGNIDSFERYPQLSQIMQRQSPSIMGKL